MHHKHALSLIDSIFVVPMCTTHVLFVECFFFIRVRNSEEKRKDTSSVFNVTFYYIDDTTSLNYSKNSRGRRGLDRMVVRFTTMKSIQSLPITTDVVNSNPAQASFIRYNVMRSSLLVTCGRWVVFSSYSGVLHQ